VVSETPVGSEWVVADLPSHLGGAVGPHPYERGDVRARRRTPQRRWPVRCGDATIRPRAGWRPPLCNGHDRQLHSQRGSPGGGHGEASSEALPPSTHATPSAQPAIGSCRSPDRRPRSARQSPRSGPRSATGRGDIIGRSHGCTTSNSASRYWASVAAYRIAWSDGPSHRCRRRDLPGQARRCERQRRDVPRAGLLAHRPRSRPSKPRVPRAPSTGRSPASSSPRTGRPHTTGCVTAAFSVSASLTLDASAAMPLRRCSEGRSGRCGRSGSDRAGPHQNDSDVCPVLLRVVGDPPQGEHRISNPSVPTRTVFDGCISSVPGCRRRPATESSSGVGTGVSSFRMP
jgi:hypothetical protein